MKCKQYNNSMTDDIYQKNIKEETSLDDGVVNDSALCGNHDIVDGQELKHYDVDWMPSRPYSIVCNTESGVA